MLASLKSKVTGHRSGDGRECRLQPRQPSSASEDGSVGDNDNASNNNVKAGRRVGEIAQALAWEKNSKVLFTKSPGGKTSSTSVSTSPETDPGSSDMFPFFAEAGPSAVDDDDDRSSLQSRRSGNTVGSTQGGQHAQGAAGSGRKLDYQNPLFHMPLQSDSQKEADQTSATVSIFPGEETPRAAMNGSNPMFSMTNRNPDGANRVQKPRPKKKDKSDDSSKENASHSSSSETPEERAARREKKKRDRVAYAHVGRMDVRATIVDEPSGTPTSASSEAGTSRSDTSKGGTTPCSDTSRSSSKSSNKRDEPSQFAHRGFRVDSFARNEGDSHEVAHFKFVFTLEAAKGTSSDHNRPVLDVVHERETGQLRVKVNDGRVVTASRSAVEITLDGIGPVLFNPRVQSKGHHLYTLRLGSSTLFSVLA